MSNSREHSQMKENISNLQARGDIFTRKYLHEKKRISSLEQKLHNVSNDIAHLRESNKQKAVSLLNMHHHTSHNKQSNNITTDNNTDNDNLKKNRRADGLDPTRLANINQKKLVRNLEGRLNKALIRNNQIQNENSQIKQKIDKLRRKIQNDNINRQIMEKNIRTVQEEMDLIMERAMYSSEERDRVLERRNQILQENLEDQHLFANEYQKLSMFIEEQAELLETSIAALASDVATKGEQAKVQMQQVDTINDTSNDLIQLETRITEMENLCENTKLVLAQTDEKIHMYEENFKQLQQVSSLTNTDQIISAFVKNEEESFSLFNYIQAVNQETDLTLEQFTKLRTEIDNYKKEQMQKESDRKEYLNEFELHLKEAQDEKKNYTELAREGKNTIEKIAKKVQTLFHFLKCDELVENSQLNNSHLHMNLSSSSKQLTRLTSYNEIHHNKKSTLNNNNKNEAISERNILRSMELIEKRSIQIIAEYAKKLAMSTSTEEGDDDADIDTYYEEESKEMEKSESGKIMKSNTKKNTNNNNTPNTNNHSTVVSKHNRRPTALLGPKTFEPLISPLAAATVTSSSSNSSPSHHLRSTPNNNNNKTSNTPVRLGSASGRNNRTTTSAASSTRGGGPSTPHTPYHHGLVTDDDYFNYSYCVDEESDDDYDEDEACGNAMSNGIGSGIHGTVTSSSGITRPVSLQEMRIQTAEKMKRAEAEAQKQHQQQQQQQIEGGGNNNMSSSPNSNHRRSPSQRIISSSNYNNYGRRTS